MKAPSDFIVIAGNIGVGKSTLAALLAAKRGYVVAPEPVETNPYLEDFYKDMTRWGFHSQIFFLTRRVHQHLDIMRHGADVIQDRSIYEDAEIFARNLYNQGTLSARDFRTYFDLYETALATLEPPRLVIYLRAQLPTLKKRIALRGRAFEQSITDSYLDGLNQLYDEWARMFTAATLVTIDVDALDFVERTQDLETVFAKI